MNDRADEVIEQHHRTVRRVRVVGRILLVVLILAVLAAVVVETWLS